MRSPGRNGMIRPKAFVAPSLLQVSGLYGGCTWLDSCSTDGLCVCGDGHTLFHIIWECSPTRTFREGYGLDQDILELLASSPHLSLWHHGLVVDPCGTLLLQISILQPKWIVHPEDGPCFSLHGFGDESGRRTQLDVTRRCGWAVVSAKLGDDGIIDIERRSEAYGPLPLC